MIYSPPPLLVSQSLLNLMGMQMDIYHRERIPQSTDAMLVVSNHRSFMDAAVLIQTLQQPIRIACHHYMGQTPLLREMVQWLGCFPLAKAEERQKVFFQQATDFLTCQQWVGLFPEGGMPMVQLTQPREVGEFQRGFAHLAFRVPVTNLAVLPVAIASLDEQITFLFPTRLLSFFDPSEPLFDRAGFHPVVVYRHVRVLIGRPYWITKQQRQQYQGKQAKILTRELTDYCRGEIANLLNERSF